MGLVAIVGTNSGRSTDRELLKSMARHFSSSTDIGIFEIKDLPAFSKPKNKLAPAPVANFPQKIAGADGVIIATPEYDHTVPAALTSALEWIAYTSRVLINKPTMTVRVSLDTLNTSRTQAHLRQILDTPELKARIIPGAEFLLGRSEQVLDDDFNLNNPEEIAELEDNFREFQSFVEVSSQIVSQADTDRKRAFAWGIK